MSMGLHMSFQGVIIMTLNESVRANDKELKAYILVYQDRHERIGEGLTMDRTIRLSYGRISFCSAEKR